MTSDGRRRTASTTLAALLLAAGTTHLLRPAPFDRIVPSALPGGARFWTLTSGVGELLLGAGLLHPRSRRRSGEAAALFFVAVLPANGKMALDAHRRGASRAWRWGTLARLPLQAVLVGWALRAAEEGRP
ncbi:putative membrane protein [Kineococcus xinjiangensis]|uniref:Putative membrane protein n=1 Tax=Kineococcus xinjiangensis TaxID=512762 RepID=A0A2S6INT2_9ACTN|nr:hypothetical protein [Kineococcus xinjiangensis]PPK95924.1 putative membrane protein [Kineococcus xinjiangensis]